MQNNVITGLHCKDISIFLKEATDVPCLENFSMFMLHPAFQRGEDSTYTITFFCDKVCNYNQIQMAIINSFTQRVCQYTHICMCLYHSVNRIYHGNPLIMSKAV